MNLCSKCPDKKKYSPLPKIDGLLLTPPEVTQSNPFLYSRSLAQDRPNLSIFLGKQDKTREH